jgi:hypothetical protein
MVTEARVHALYRLLLCREPEDAAIVQALMNYEDLPALVTQCVRSEEFLVRYRSALRKCFGVGGFDA